MDAVASGAGGVVVGVVGAQLVRQRVRRVVAGCAVVAAGVAVVVSDWSRFRIGWWVCWWVGWLALTEARFRRQRARG